MVEEKARRTVRPYPADTLEEAIQLAQAIQDNNNGRAMNRIMLASAIQRKPASSEFKMLLSSGMKYGLTSGNEKSETIGLTALGGSITKPRTPDERLDAVRKAALQPELVGKIYNHFANGKLPDGTFFQNVLERDFGVPRERCQECADLVYKNGRFAGLLKDLQGATYVIFNDGSQASEEVPSTDPSEEPVRDDLLARPLSSSQSHQNDSTQQPVTPPRERAVFIGHGKNRTPLEQLERSLKKLGLPYKVAIDEPQLFRPISEKVAQTMRECHAAILIFTKDEEFRTPQDEVIWRPSQNVIYELGAASVLYEDRIVIFKEDGLDFPTNFKDIGYIPFESNKLDARGGDLFTELIGLGLIKVQLA